ncbi:cell division cycle and apoptosis regulator protein [Anaeramoeba flamelloides]|uniref:Cell division cycle and apoptosis regulator protein n=1 Tax=Anaeramoeba flamelloides TaxID=1746091 RepID=A0AAV7YAF1_9EUKA|nr:cell division cycle and apoptosis regulator protein [Anaeramoeba flamelloides]
MNWRSHLRTLLLRNSKEKNTLPNEKIAKKASQEIVRHLINESRYISKVKLRTNDYRIQLYPKKLQDGILALIYARDDPSSNLRFQALNHVITIVNSTSSAYADIILTALLMVLEDKGKESIHYNESKKEEKKNEEENVKEKEPEKQKDNEKEKEIQKENKVEQVEEHTSIRAKETSLILIPKVVKYVTDRNIITLAQNFFQTLKKVLLIKNGFIYAALNSNHFSQVFQTFGSYIKLTEFQSLVDILTNNLTLTNPEIQLASGRTLINLYFYSSNEFSILNNLKERIIETETKSETETDKDKETGKENTNKEEIKEKQEQEQEQEQEQKEQDKIKKKRNYEFLNLILKNWEGDPKFKLQWHLGSLKTLFYFQEISYYNPYNNEIEIRISKYLFQLILNESNNRIKSIALENLIILIDTIKKQKLKVKKIFDNNFTRKLINFYHKEDQNLTIGVKSLILNIFIQIFEFYPKLCLNYFFPKLVNNNNNSNISKNVINTNTNHINNNIKALTTNTNPNTTTNNKTNKNLKNENTNINTTKTSQKKELISILEMKKSNLIKLNKNQDPQIRKKACILLSHSINYLLDQIIGIYPIEWLLKQLLKQFNDRLIRKELADSISILLIKSLKNINYIHWIKLFLNKLIELLTQKELTWVTQIHFIETLGKYLNEGDLAQQTIYKKKIIKTIFKILIESKDSRIQLSCSKQFSLLCNNWNTITPIPTPTTTTTTTSSSNNSIFEYLIKKILKILNKVSYNKQTLEGIFGLLIKIWENSIKSNQKEKQIILIENFSYLLIDFLSDYLFCNEINLHIQLLELINLLLKSEIITKKYLNNFYMNNTNKKFPIKNFELIFSHILKIITIILNLSQGITLSQRKQIESQIIKKRNKIKIKINFNEYKNQIIHSLNKKIQNNNNNNNNNENNNNNQNNNNNYQNRHNNRKRFLIVNEKKLFFHYNNDDDLQSYSDNSLYQKYYEKLFYLRKIGLTMLNQKENKLFLLSQISFEILINLIKILNRDIIYYVFQLIELLKKILDYDLINYSKLIGVIFEIIFKKFIKQKKKKKASKRKVQRKKADIYFEKSFKKLTMPLMLNCRRILDFEIRSTILNTIQKLMKYQHNNSQDCLIILKFIKKGFI